PRSIPTGVLRAIRFQRCPARSGFGTAIFEGRAAPSMTIGLSAVAERRSNAADARYLIVSAPGANAAATLGPESEIKLMQVTVSLPLISAHRFSQLATKFPSRPFVRDLAIRNRHSVIAFTYIIRADDNRESKNLALRHSAGGRIFMTTCYL